MKALVYKQKGIIELCEKPLPEIQNENDAIVKVTLSTICTSDLHIMHGAVPQAKEGVTLGHEFVGVVTALGKNVKNLKVGDRVSANCITFCGECRFCKRGFINNCIKGGWEIGCKIDGCQAEYVRVPFAQTGLTKLPDNVSDENALFVGDILSSGYFGAELCNIKQNDIIAVIGAGPVGLCSMMCARLLGASRVIAIDIDNTRLDIAVKNKLADYTINPAHQDLQNIIEEITGGDGADGVIEAAGGENTFEVAWKIARPNSVVALVAMYEKAQKLPLPDMYGKNLIFKTGGVDATHCEELVKYISEGKISTDILISKKMAFEDILKAYKMFEEKTDNCLKIAITY
ncbi:MAG: alcohol dehydrogenase catalytic domain-containing protein [Brachyspira sp.]|jgi:ankyrin repeat-containing protein|nr:alcohol dehydrogenase catalytic domain-containing protein [Brachyspira sp.]